MTMTMLVELRRLVEKKIAEAFIDSVLGAGHRISVYDGGAFPLRNSTSKKDILEAMFSTDGDILYVFNVGGKRLGWCEFVYGNDGYDVISDYSTNLEPYMVEANRVSDKFQ